jgi:MATE family multidrug resistance protein
VGLQYAAEVSAFAAAGVLAGVIGRLEAAAHQVALTLASVIFNVAMGLSSAAAVRVGLAIGAADAPGTRRAGAASLLVVGCVMLTSAIVMALFPEALARLVTNDENVIEVAAVLVQIAAVFQLSDGAQAVGAGVLRGSGDTRAAFVANLVGHYGIGLPLAVWLAFGLGWSTPGLWWGLSAALTAVAVFLWARFFWRARTPIARS